MTATGAKSLPVLDQGRTLVGVISRSDITRVLARDDAAIAADVGQLLTSVGHEGWMVEVTDGAVSITGPTAPGESSIATAVARTVLGVADVHVEAPT